MPRGSASTTTTRPAKAGSAKTKAAKATDRGGAISRELLDSCRVEFKANPAYRLAMNACSQGSVDEISLNRRAVSAMDWHFSHEVPTGSISNQKKAGLCWMFASLNWLRVPVIDKLKLETFEFSYNYLTFYDRLEKANRFLTEIVAHSDRPTDDRMVDFLLREPSSDGGEWHMVANLIRKYGIVPKSAMGDTFNVSDSTFLNKVLHYKQREAAAIIFDLQRSGAKEAEIEKAKTKALSEIYRILCILMGEPPERFDFTYRDKKKKFHAHRDLTPHTFFEEIVGIDLDDYVWIMSSPLPDTPYFKTFCIDQFQNVVEGRPGTFLNVPMPILKDLAIRVLKDKKAVLFGCDVLQESSRKIGILDSGILEYELLFDMAFSMNRAQRMQTLQARLTHNMVLLGVDLVDDRPVKWKIENSWGDEVGHKGIFMMTDAWFDEHVYAVVVHKKYLDKEHAALFKGAPTVLPAWHPLA